MAFDPQQLSEAERMRKLSALGIPGIDFIPVARYDKDHGGSYGDERYIPALNWAAKFKGGRPAVTAGYANYGHSNGRGGEHAYGALDFDGKRYTPGRRQEFANYLMGSGLFEKVVVEDDGHIHSKLGKPGLKSPILASAPSALSPSFVPPKATLKGSPADFMAVYNQQKTQSPLAAPLPAPLPVVPPQAQLPSALQYIQDSREAYNKSLDQDFANVPQPSRGGRALAGMLVAGPLGLLAGIGSANRSRRERAETIAKLKTDHDVALLGQLNALNNAYAPYQDSAFANKAWGTPNQPASKELLMQAGKDYGASNTAADYMGYLSQKRDYDKARNIAASQGDYTALRKLGSPPATPEAQQGRGVNADTLNLLLKNLTDPSNQANDINMAKAPTDMAQGMASANLNSVQAQYLPQQVAAQTTQAGAAATNAATNSAQAAKQPNLAALYDLAAKGDEGAIAVLKLLHPGGMMFPDSLPPPGGFGVSGGEAAPGVATGNDNPVLRGSILGELLGKGTNKMQGVPIKSKNGQVFYVPIE